MGKKIYVTTTYSSSESAKNVLNWTLPLMSSKCWEAQVTAIFHLYKSFKFWALTGYKKVLFSKKKYRYESNRGEGGIYLKNQLKGNKISSSESGGGGNITIRKIYTPYLQCWNKNTFWTVFSSLCFHQYVRHQFVLHQIVLPVYLHLQILPFLILGSIMSSAQLRPPGFKVFYCTIIIIL